MLSGLQVEDVIDRLLLYTELCYSSWKCGFQIPRTLIWESSGLLSFPLSSVNVQFTSTMKKVKKVIVVLLQPIAEVKK